MPKTLAFKKIKASLSKQYLGKKVPSLYQERYGKVYGKKDIDSFAYALAKSRGIKVDKKKLWR